MKKYERMTKAELIKRINALENGNPSASIAFEHERLNHELQVHQIELETQNRELREMHQLLEVSRNRYADLYDFAPVGYATFNARGVIVEINLTAAGMLGVERSRLLGVPFRLHVAVGDVALFREHLRKRSSPGASIQTELRLTRKDHSILPVSMQSVAYYDDEREEEVFRTAITDITAREQADRALRDHEAKLSATLSTAVDGIISIDEQGTIESFNRAAEHLFGYPAHEVIGSNVNVLMPPPYRENHDHYLAHYRDTGERKVIGIGREVEGRRKDGSIFPIEISVGEVRLSGRRSFTGFIRDITKRKVAEDALREETNFIAAVLQTAGALVIVLDSEGQIIRFNHACELVSGYSAAEVTGRSVWKLLVPKNDVATVQSEVKRLISTRNPGQLENEWLTKDGQRRLISWSNTTISNPNGTVRFLIGIGIDITERRQVEDALREQKQRYQSLLEASPDAIYLVKHGRIEFTNPEGVRLLGLRSASQVLGKSPFDFFRENRQEIIRQRIDSVSGDGKGLGISPVVEERFTRPDGTVRWVTVTSALFTEKNETSLLLILRDITDHKRLENEILEIGDREQQNIGHELHDGLGQQLTGLEMKFYLLAEDLAKKDLNSNRARLQRDVEEIGAMLRESITLTRSLARGLTTVNLKAEGLTGSLRRLALDCCAGNKVECTLDCLSPVTLENAQTARHLFRIAQEAVNNALKHARAKHIQISLRHERNELTLRIKDDGRGLPARKKTSRGLGLEIMRHRANSIGASLELVSSPGKGVTIDCILPLKKNEH